MKVEVQKKEKKPEPQSKPKQTQPPGNDAKLKLLEKDLKKVEEQISKLEEQKTLLEMEMTKPEIFGSIEKLKMVQSEFTNVQSELLVANKKWEDVATAIDELNAG